MAAPDKNSTFTPAELGLLDRALNMAIASAERAQNNKNTTPEFVSLYKQNVASYRELQIKLQKL